MTTLRVQTTRELMAAGLLWNDLAFAADEPGHLEIVLAPGVYSGVGLVLADSSPTNAVSLVLRGEPGATLRDASLHLSGPSVHVRDLVFEGRRSDFFVNIQATEEVHLQRLAFVGVRAGERSHYGSGVEGGAISVEATGPGVRALTEDVWLVKAEHLGRQPLIRFIEQSGRFDSVVLRRVAANKLRGSGLVGLNAQTPLTLEQCAVVLKGQAAVVTSSRPTSAIRVTGGAYAVHASDNIVRAVEAYDRMVMEYLPANVEGARLLVRTHDNDREPGSILVNCQVQPGPRKVSKRAWVRKARSLASPDATELLPE
ncbi:MAG: hypothetical protein ACI9MC_000140 [Kiritimatiellia bacterium]|jgi:hypothetical protein